MKGLKVDTAGEWAFYPADVAQITKAGVTVVYDRKGGNYTLGDHGKPLSSMQAVVK